MLILTERYQVAPIEHTIYTTYDISGQVNITYSSSEHIPCTPNQLDWEEDSWLPSSPTNNILNRRLKRQRFVKRYHSRLRQLKGRGFEDDEKTLDALMFCEGNVQHAVEYLLERL